MIRTASALALLALAAASPSQAQDPTPQPGGVAVARLPNTFDSPAPAARPTRPAPPATPASAATGPASGPVSGPASAEVAATTRADERSEGLLRTLITGAQGDGMDYSLLTDALAEQVRPQAAQIGPLLRGMGTIQAVDWVGADQGVDFYIVVFSTGVAQWLIGVTDEGKVSALRFRPVRQNPDETPAPSPAGG